VSAIVVTYESAAVLAALLPVLAAAVDELVVVDNASTDGSAARSRALVPGAVVVELAVNRGFAAGVNAGVAASSGELLLLCNPDVELTADAVDALVAAAQRHPGDVVGPVVRFPDGRLQPSRNGRPTLRNLLGEQLLVPESTRPGTWPARLWPRWQSYAREVPGPILSGCSLLVPRSAFTTVGGFDEGYFLYWEEVDWQLRAAELGITSWLVPAAEVRHARVGSGGAGEAARAAVFHRSTRRFLRRWVPPASRLAAVVLLGLGQLLRLLAWSLPPLRSAPPAADRRAQHRLALRTLWTPAR
jgi:N-acetylglucosaminyl-diphospho-decaprenol L-rhamnosyltransferase